MQFLSDFSILNRSLQIARLALGFLPDPVKTDMLTH